MTDPTKRPQAEQILEYLQQGHELTALEALEKFGSNRLAARIADIKHKGFNVKSRTVTRNKKKFSSYYLAEHEKEILNV